jgi:ferredoxin-NADP reductase
MDDLIDRRPVLRARATVRAKIKEKREVAKGTLLVVFDLLGERFDYRAGQYFWVELLDPPYQDGKGPRRHISAVTSPTERGVIGLCTRVRDSAFKRSLAELPVGVDVEVEPPRGKFVLPDDGRAPSSSSPAGSASPPSARCFATSRTKGSRTGLR